MAGLILWKNEEINRLRRDMDRLFSRLWDDFGISMVPRHAREVPSLDLSETEDALVLKVEIPGMNPDDLEISITDDLLTIKGEKKEESNSTSGDYHRRERHYGRFTRNLQLPCRITIEEVDAVYREGVLTVVMPKCKTEKARELRIKVK